MKFSLRLIPKISGRDKISKKLWLQYQKVIVWSNQAKFKLFMIRFKEQF